MDASLKKGLIVDIRVMAPSITADIIQTGRIERGGGIPEPLGGVTLVEGGQHRGSLRGCR